MDSILCSYQCTSWATFPHFVYFTIRLPRGNNVWFSHLLISYFTKMLPNITNLPPQKKYICSTLSTHLFLLFWIFNSQTIFRDGVSNLDFLVLPFCELGVHLNRFNINLDGRVPIMSVRDFGYIIVLMEH